MVPPGWDRGHLGVYIYFIQLLFFFFLLWPLVKCRKKIMEWTMSTKNECAASRKDNKESFTIKITSFSYFGKKSNWRTEKNIIKNAVFHLSFFVILFMRVIRTVFFSFCSPKASLFGAHTALYSPSKVDLRDFRVLMRLVSRLRSTRSWKRSLENNKKRSQKLAGGLWDEWDPAPCWVPRHRPGVVGPVCELVWH